MINIAIDGPSGAGKSTIAKTAAKMLGYIYIDTGAMYRTVGLAAVRHGIDTSSDKDGITAILNQIDIDIRYEDGIQHIFLNHEDVTDYIRTPEISLAASHVAVIPAVRQKMTEFQRLLAKSRNCIMDGRDIGTNVLCDAQVKIFLTADVAARAKRRYDELLQKNTSVSFDGVLKDMKFRDNNDSTREYMPLKMADDAILIDTTNINLEESVNVVMNCIKTKLSEDKNAL